MDKRFARGVAAGARRVMHRGEQSKLQIQGDDVDPPPPPQNTQSKKSRLPEASSACHAPRQQQRRRAAVSTDGDVVRDEVIAAEGLLNAWVARCLQLDARLSKRDRGDGRGERHDGDCLLLVHGDGGKRSNSKHEATATETAESLCCPPPCCSVLWAAHRSSSLDQRYQCSRGQD
jgi:hypothetical protein